MEVRFPFMIGFMVFMLSAFAVAVYVMIEAIIKAAWNWLQKCNHVWEREVKDKGQFGVGVVPSDDAVCFKCGARYGQEPTDNASTTGG